MGAQLFQRTNDIVWTGACQQCVPFCSDRFVELTNVLHQLLCTDSSQASSAGMLPLSEALRCPHFGNNKLLFTLRHSLIHDFISPDLC